MEVEHFMKKMHEQTARPKESIDKDILRIINSWRKKETPAYKKFREDPDNTDASYLGAMSAKAAVDKEVAWKYVEAELSPCYDQTRQDDLKDEFETAFNNTLPDMPWRNRVFSRVINK